MGKSKQSKVARKDRAEDLTDELSPRAIELFLQEMRKARPSQAKIKNLMMDAGLTYTPDSLDQLTRVLERLQTSNQELES